MLRSFYVRQAFFAIAHATCLLFALSPFDIWPLGILAITAMAAAAQKLYHSTAKQIIVSWIFFAVATTLIPFGWIFPTIDRYTGGIFLLTAGLTLLYALLFQTKFLLLFVLARYWHFANIPTPDLLAIAACFAVADLISPELFPWSWGNGVFAFSWLRQLAAIGSVYLVSLASALWGLLLLQLWQQRSKKLRALLKDQSASLALAFSTIVVGAILYYYPSGANRGKLHTLVVQTNIGAAAADKQSDNAFATDAINRLFNQTLDGLLLYGAIDLIVWPEASMPFHSADRTAANESIYSPTFDAVAEYLHRKSGAALVFQDMFFIGSALHSRFAVRPEALPENFYLKRRLVPWGEFLPLSGLFPALRKIFPHAGRFSAATEIHDIALPVATNKSLLHSREQVAAELAYLAIPAAVRKHLAPPQPARFYHARPALCYEALYPTDVRTQKADLILNLASDAWFGDGLEGHQHASAAIMRAVENGIPMVRAAMSGVTVIADARGNDLALRSAQARTQNIFAEIPLERRSTIFARFGMASFWALVLACFWPAVLLRFSIATKMRHNS